MKTSVKKTTHTGTQPIRVLKHNLTHRITNRNESLIKNLQSDLKLGKSIKYHIAELPLCEKQTPFIDENGVINLHETYLSFIWTVTFSVFVLYEEVISIPDQLKREAHSHKKQNLELVALVEDLLNYSKSLIITYAEWDKDYFPNPEYYDENTEEGSYILKTNDLYVEVINFILYHEIAHAELEHIEKIKVHKLTDDEIKTLELEADSRAVILMLENNRNKKVTELAIIIGLASILFLNSNLEGGRRHPNIDIRIKNAIDIIGLKDESELWAFLALFLKLWDNQFGHNFNYKSEYNTYKDLYDELIKQAK